MKVRERMMMMALPLLLQIGVLKKIDAQVLEDNRNNFRTEMIYAPPIVSVDTTISDTTQPNYIYSTKPLVNNLDRGMQPMHFEFLTPDNCQEVLHQFKHIPEKLLNDIGLRDDSTHITLAGVPVKEFQALIRGRLGLPKELYIQFENDERVFRIETVYGGANLPGVQLVGNFPRIAGEYYLIYNQKKFHIQNSEIVPHDIQALSIEHQLFQEDFLELLRSFKGCSYNTNSSKQDYKLSSDPKYLSKHTYIWDYYANNASKTDEPLRICSSLITDALYSMSMLSKYSKDDESYDTRFDIRFPYDKGCRVSTQMPYALSGSFESIDFGKIDPPNGIYPRLYPGDILIQNGHSAVVSEVDSVGRPKKIIESTRRGVTEMEFYNQNSPVEMWADRKGTRMCFWKKNRPIIEVLRPKSSYLKKRYLK